MSNRMKNILTLNHEEVMNFFMKSEQYHGFELPEYFTFDEVLKFVRETIGKASYVIIPAFLRTTAIGVRSSNDSISIVTWASSTKQNSLRVCAR